VISVPSGILVSWLINRRWGPGVSSGGVTETMMGLALHNGYISTRMIPAKLAATAATLGTFGSGGREGPIALIGGAIGSGLARYTKFGQDRIRSLLAAGAGAGIGASFNAPIAGMMFAMEVVLGSFAIRHLNAVVIASVVAAVTSQQLIGDERILRAPAHALDDPKQLLLYAVLALLAVLFGLLFIRLLDFVSSAGERWRLPGWLLPIAAGVVVGLIGVVSPETLGSGQEFLGGLLGLTDAGEYVWYGLIAIAIGKGITNALTRSGGGSVGAFMPSLVIGGAVGAAFAILIDPLWTFSNIDPGAYAVVGMAATFAIVGKAPLTSVIIVFEVTGDYGLVLPLMLGAALATYVGDRFHADSAYTLPLKRKGIHLPTNEDIDLLDTVSVREVMSSADTVTTPGTSLTELEHVLSSTHHHGIPVVDTDTGLVGVATWSDIANAGGPSDDRTVAEAMSKNPITVTADLPVSAALARMASLGVGRMPVVSEDDPSVLVGMFRRESVVRAYHHALGTSTGRHLYRDRVRLRSHPGARFFELPVLRGSPVANARIETVPWPPNVIVVSVRRGSAVLIPHGSTELEVGDTITVFGTGPAREELAGILEPTTDSTGEWTALATDRDGGDRA